MKVFAIAFSLLYFLFLIVNVEFSSSKGIIYKDRRDSYESCIKLKMKAPYINLNCDNLLVNIDNNGENTHQANNIGEYKIKTLYLGKNGTRKVNKIEEIKLRNLIENLSKN